MIVELINYRDERTRFDIGDIKDISYATMQVMYGDEFLIVGYRNNKVLYYDSYTHGQRSANHIEDEYDIYIPGKINLFVDEQWLNRKTSYSYAYDC